MNLLKRLEEHQKKFQISRTKALTRIGMLVSNQAKINVMRTFKEKKGPLMNSISYRVKGNTVEIGSYGVVYAAIHELGGVITPKRVQWLTIPTKEYRGRFPREFNLHVFKSKSGVSGLMDESGRAAFIFKKQVKIPARPYLKPAFETQAETIKKIIGAIVWPQ